MAPGLANFQEVSGSSKCPACSDNGQWSASGLCKVAAVEYLCAIRSTAPETPARFVVVQRCWGYLHGAMALDASHSKSMVLAGILHQSGLGTEKNETMAAKAAKALSFSARHMLAEMHLERFTWRVVTRKARDADKTLIVHANSLRKQMLLGTQWLPWNWR